MNDCVFCKIAHGTIPAEKVYEDDISLAFLDINPVNEGHLLIIPKTHYDNMAMTPDHLIESLFVKAKNFMPALGKAVDADFVVLTVVGTDVPHFHIHLIPRFHKDGLAGFWPAKKYNTIEKMREVRDRIEKQILLN